MGRLPVGMQLIAAPGRESLLREAGQELEGRLAGAASVAREANGNPMMPVELKAWYDRMLEPAWRSRSEDGQRIWEDGQAMSLAEAVQCALRES